MPSIPFKVVPWTIPLHIHLESAKGVNLPSGPIASGSPLITPQLLAEMCEEFRANVFRLYALQDPRNSYAIRGNGPTLNCKGVERNDWFVPTPSTVEPPSPLPPNSGYVGESPVAIPATIKPAWADVPESIRDMRDCCGSSGYTITGGSVLRPEVSK